MINYEKEKQQFLQVADALLKATKKYCVLPIIEMIQDNTEAKYVSDDLPNLLDFWVENNIYTIDYDAVQETIFLSPYVDLDGCGIVDIGDYLNREEWYEREEILAPECDYIVDIKLSCPDCGKTDIIRSQAIEGGRYGRFAPRIMLQAYGTPQDQIRDRVWECDCGHAMIGEILAIHEINEERYKKTTKISTEYCPWCDCEVSHEIPIEAKSVICPDCGKKLWLCTECMYYNGECCNPDCCTSYCYEDTHQPENPIYPDPKY